MGEFGETRGGVGKSGVLEHKSGNISATRKDRGKVIQGVPKLLKYPLLSKERLSYERQVLYAHS